MPSVNRTAVSTSPHGTVGATDDLPTIQRRAWLTAILVGAAALRLFRISWGLPQFIFHDTRMYFVEAAHNAVGAGDWILDFFIHPPLYPYLVAIATWIWAAVTGDDFAVTGNAAQASRATIVIIGRVLTVAMSTGMIGATYLLGRRLLGSRVGLWAAAFVALSPLQILESHRVNVDSPMLLAAVLSAHQAVVALQEKRKNKLLLSFALAALAGATKYTGLYAGTLPIWAALRWPDTSWSRRARLIAAGGLASLAMFSLAMSPVLLAREDFARQVYQLFYIGIFHGAPGQNLTGDSWVFAPYLYLTVVGLPFVLGWAIYAASLAGLVTLSITNRTALALIAAGALPYYILQGNAETAVARYYLPFLPFLAITAAAFVTWIRRTVPRIGTVIAALVVVYSTILACSQVNRIGGVPQATIGKILQRLAVAKRSSGITVRAVDQPKLVIAYPSWAPGRYDALLPYMKSSPNRHLVYLPRILRSPGEAIAPADALREDRRWIETAGVDVIIVTSRWEHLRERKSFFPREEQFYQHLTQGRLGLRPVAHEETTHFTQSWYEWADPTLDTIWTAGIGGYTLYVRDDLLPGLK